MKDLLKRRARQAIEDSSAGVRSKRPMALRDRTVSVQPRGCGSLVYNWYVDDGDDLTVNTKYLLDKTTVLQRGPFSIHFTAGPDVINFGDGNGMDLNNNKKSQALPRELAGLKKTGKDDKDDKKSRLPDHAIGSHGGWIHDF